jgi:hypothetical protein
MPKNSTDDPAGARSERLFTLRIWRETGAGSAGPLRGSIVEVGTDQRFLFTHLADLRDFLSLRLAVPETE